MTEREPEKIKVSIGATINLGNFNTVRIDIGVEDRRRREESFEEAFNRVYNWVEAKIESKISEQKNGIRQRRSD